MLTGLFSLFAPEGLYQHLRDADESFALLALLFTATGTAEAAIHGAYDLASSINPPAQNDGSQQKIYTLSRLRRLFRRIAINRTLPRVGTMVHGDVMPIPWAK